MMHEAALNVDTANKPSEAPFNEDSSEDGKAAGSSISVDAFAAWCGRPDAVDAVDAVDATSSTGHTNVAVRTCQRRKLCQMLGSDSVVSSRVTCRGV